MKKRKNSNQLNITPESEKTPVSAQMEKPSGAAASREKAASSDFPEVGKPELKNAPLTDPNGKASVEPGCKNAGEQGEKAETAKAEQNAKEKDTREASVTSVTSKNRKILIGRLMIVLGVLLIASALLLQAMNQKESDDAGRASQELLMQLRNQILENAETAPTEPLHVNPYDQEAVELSQEMPVKVINGWPYIGYLHIPAIDLDLPVMGDWSYEKLGVAPCRHMGSTRSDDIVIAAHNFPTHFGHIKELQQGDEVEFVDMDGILSRYQVCTVNQIEPEDIEEVKAEELDLVLYTCTYGGAHRIMVGCQRIGEE